MPTPILLLDGGLGTTLAYQHGCIFSESTPLWSSHLLLSDPDSALLKTQTAFADAGADVILSATYQASYEGFARTGDGVGEREAGRLMRRSVKIARASFKQKESDKGTVALSLGAYGATMVPSQEYSGKYDESHLSVEALRAWHVKRLQAFVPVPAGRSDSLEEEEEKIRVWGDIGYVAFETVPLLQEIEAVRAAMTGMKREFWVSCVFPGEENKLPDGSCIRDVVRAMLERQKGLAVPWGIGVNCTKVGKVEGLILEFEKEVQLLISGREAEWPSLVIYPDGTDGEIYNTVTKEWVKGPAGRESETAWDETIFGIVERARERGRWRSILVGGCCKTTPKDIERLRRRIDGFS
ncbi:homocysteine S-methyltransferase [Diplocarpon rosae]|nr:homocysteine S-methyltransferase [Diplocarpon rosae]